MKLDRKRRYSDLGSDEDESIPKRSRREHIDFSSGSDDDDTSIKRARTKRIKNYQRLYQAEVTKNKNLEDECKEKIEELSAQLKELKELDDDCKLDVLSKSVINSVTIDDLNRILMLLANNQMYAILRSRKYLRALQKLFVGLMYGIIPITVSQRIALTEKETVLVKELENASVDRVKSYISSNREAFTKLFDVVDDSIKLVTKTYKRYGDLYKEDDY